jgi:hypothetical protein
MSGAYSMHAIEKNAYSFWYEKVEDLGKDGKLILKLN